MFGEPEKDHGNCKHGRFVGGIRAGDFGVQVGSVSACIKLLHEVRNSLLLWDGTCILTVQIQSAT